VSHGRIMVRGGITMWDRDQEVRMGAAHPWGRRDALSSAPLYYDQQLPYIQGRCGQ
jgi:hypothetical protein